MKKGTMQTLPCKTSISQVYSNYAQTFDSEALRGWSVHACWGVNLK